MNDPAEAYYRRKWDDVDITEHAPLPGRHLHSRQMTTPGDEDKIILVPVDGPMSEHIKGRTVPVEQ